MFSNHWEKTKYFHIWWVFEQELPLPNLVQFVSAVLHKKFIDGKQDWVTQTLIKFKCKLKLKFKCKLKLKFKCKLKLKFKCKLKLNWHLKLL
jgi:hypothetical protein